MEDLKSFQEFFDYEPCNEENPTDILESILSKARKYLKQHKQQIEKLAQALFEKKHLKSSEILSLIG